MTMLETVARAMWRARTGSTKHPWSALGTIQDEYRDMARAAVDAMRLECDPFDSVVDAIQTAVDIWPEDKPRPASNCVQFVSLEEAVSIWNAGVDAILAEAT